MKTIHGTFALVWSCMLDSSLWVDGSKEARLLFLTMLMLKNKEGEIRMSFPGLRDRAKLTQEECTAALKELMAPDKESQNKELNGRRIVELEDGGWKVVSHEKYRFTTEEQRKYWADQKAKQRLGVKSKKGKPTRAELVAKKVLDAGGTPEQADAAVDKMAPGVFPKHLRNQSVVEPEFGG
jgi:hypothetical protein